MKLNRLTYAGSPPLLRWGTSKPSAEMEEPELIAIRPVHNNRKTYEAIHSQQTVRTLNTRDALLYDKGSKDPCAKGEIVDPGGTGLTHFKITMKVAR